MQTRSCDLPLDKYATEQGEASKVLPLAKSIVFKTAPVRSVSPINERFPGHVSIDTEHYGIRKESLQAMLYPAIHKYIKSATTILSLDTDASELLNVVVECSSGGSRVRPGGAALCAAVAFWFSPAGKTRVDAGELYQRSRTAGRVLWGDGGAGDAHSGWPLAIKRGWKAPGRMVRNLRE
jgi:hypothetical protein